MEEIKESVTPAEEPQVIEAVEETETEATQEEEQTSESEETSEVDYQQKYESLEKEVMRMKQIIASREEENEQKQSEPDIDLPKDVQKYLEDFATNPHGLREKEMAIALKPLQQAIRAMEQQQAIDYIHMQKDFTPEMYDELLYIIDGPERNKYFNYGNTNVKLKDLPPRVKAEAALQIYRARTKETTKPTTRPKPNTTAKSKTTGKKSAKSDEMLTAEEFAKKYGLKDGAL